MKHRVLLVALCLVTGLATHTASATEVKGSFDGKVQCAAGRRKAEFKSPGTQSLSYSSPDEIKRRINELTWPSSGETHGFTEREKEKIELQHALKAIREKNCDEQPETQETIDPNERGSGPALSPHPD